MDKSAEVYEKHYQKKNSFSFGKNWNNFLNYLNDTRIKVARKSIAEYIPDKEVIGKSVVDIGCGSGLFSLAAYLMKAGKITSSDIDDFSIECAKYLKNKSGNPKNWEIKKGSILDDKFVRNLGKFDIVYSWGVLHHTGNMYKAFENVIKLCKPGALLYIAIYNKNQGKNALLIGSSTTWLKIKRTYNNMPLLGKKLMEYIYLLWFFTGYLMLFKNPFSYINNYQRNRGMDFFTDVRDWLGGYPYEFATLEELINYFGDKGFTTRKVKESVLGCHELLLKMA
jgi:2-polyprenyl-6-hydroxyphenyl methylase/3-demethylubiquinone-9 3-methyltransferase